MFVVEGWTSPWWSYRRMDASLQFKICSLSKDGRLLAIQKRLVEGWTSPWWSSMFFAAERNQRCGWAMRKDQYLYFENEMPLYRGPKSPSPWQAYRAISGPMMWRSRCVDFLDHAVAQPIKTYWRLLISMCPQGKTIISEHG